MTESWPSARNRLLVFSSSMGEGGAQRVTSTLLAHLPRELFELELAVFRRRFDFDVPDDVRVHALLPGDAPMLKAAARRRPWVLARLFAWVRALIESRRPDVVLTNIEQVGAVVGTVLRTTRHRPRWVSRLGTAPAPGRTAVEEWSGWANRRADAIVGNAAGLCRAAASRHTGWADKLVHIPNPTDFERIDELAARQPALRRDPEQPLLVTVSRFIRDKRIDLLLDVMEQVTATISARLWICADGELRRDIEADVRRRGLEGIVTLLGFQQNPYALVRQADLFVLTSDREGLPNALIEAQGLGIPAVSTDCDFGPGEIITPGATGLLTLPGDARALATAIVELLRDRDRRRQMGRAAAKSARDAFGIESALAAWQRVLGGAQPSAG